MIIGMRMVIVKGITGAWCNLPAIGVILVGIITFPIAGRTVTKQPHRKLLSIPIGKW